MDKIVLLLYFSVGVLTTLIIILTSIFEKSLTSAFTTLVFIQPFILIDLFLSHHHIATHYRLLFNPIFIAAFLFPFLIHPLLLYQPLLQQVFKTSLLDWQTFFTLAFISSLILLGIRGVKEVLRI